MSKQFYTNRRGFLRAMGLTAGLTAVAAQRGTFGYANALAGDKESGTLRQGKPNEKMMTTMPFDIQPFNVNMPQPALVDLRKRIAATRWPSKETVADASQGVQLATMQALTHYWAKDYDWRKTERKLNALPQFKTEIDGLDIHFIHVRSKQKNALPLILTHGWPGSIIEMLDVIDPLTDPTAHGGRAEDAFDVVIPSLPGHGFSAEPTTVGWGPDRVAVAWAKLMAGLGYTRYVAQGGDQGAIVTDILARIAPQGLLGVHFNLLTAFPPEIRAALFGGAPLPQLSEEELTAFKLVAATFRRGYFVEMVEHPQTIGYALADSPVGLAAWMLDHDADSYAKISRAFLDGQVTGNLTRDRIVDNITLYWLTNTGASAARLYWELGRLIAASATQPPTSVAIPVAFSVFPGEVYKAPRAWVEKVYPNLVYFNQVDKGGHFAAWEEPALFASEMRAAFKSLR
jgi:pimeloyl-ACP methyl ester carboxylesterase